MSITTCYTVTLISILKGINIHLAKKMIEDRSRDYMNARRVAKVGALAVIAGLLLYSV